MDDAGTFDGLYDLETDPREEHNVIALYPEVIIANPTRIVVSVLISSVFFSPFYEHVYAFERLKS